MGSFVFCNEHSFYAASCCSRQKLLALKPLRRQPFSSYHPFGSDDPKPSFALHERRYVAFCRDRLSFVSSKGLLAERYKRWLGEKHLL
jgi:hypothetical protein